MFNNMFSIIISFYDGHTQTLPIPRSFIPLYINSNGMITYDGIVFLTNQYFFLDEIRSGMVKCNDYKSLIMLFGHKNLIRESISIKTSFESRYLKDCSKIFNHTHIGMGHFLTPKGFELVFGSNEYNTSWIHIDNHFIVFKEFYEYCQAHVSDTITKQPSFISTSIPQPTTQPTTQLTTPQKKHTADNDIICPDAPKKGRKK